MYSPLITTPVTGVVAAMAVAVLWSSTSREPGAQKTEKKKKKGEVRWVLPFIRKREYVVMWEEVPSGMRGM